MGVEWIIIVVIIWSDRGRNNWMANRTENYNGIILVKQISVWCVLSSCDTHLCQNTKQDCAASTSDILLCYHDKHDIIIRSLSRISYPSKGVFSRWKRKIYDQSGHWRRKTGYVPWIRVIIVEVKIKAPKVVDIRRDARPDCSIIAARFERCFIIRKVGARIIHLFY